MNATIPPELAILGGAPVRTAPIPPWPYFAPDEIEAVTRVLTSGKVNYWTGTEGRQFETEYAETVGCGHGIAVANGTVSLEMLLYAYDIGPGDEVITTPRTFMASASSIVMRGATPVFADVDRDSGNITAETIEAVITPRTKAIIPVHLAGWPCDMDPIMALAERHGLKVIEDCAQSHGAMYKGRHTGNLGHGGSFSFCQDKILTTGGEGGLVTINDEALWRKMWAFKDHGKSYAACHERQHPPGYRWLIESFGTNMRMTEMQAAIGRIILRKLPEWSAIRRRNARILIDRLAPWDALRIPTPPEGSEHAWYKFYAYVRPERLQPDWNRDRLLHAIAAEGFTALSGSCSEIYLEKAFDGTRPDHRLPVARELGETAMLLLVHPTLTEADMHQMADAVEKVLRVAQA